MALKGPMSLEKARLLAQRVAHGRKKYGPQFSIPYSKEEIVEALALLENNGNWDGPTKEQLTKANRQLAACNARLARSTKNLAAADAAIVEIVTTQNVENS